MKSHEVRIAEAITSLTRRLETWGVDDAHTKAHEFVRDMLHNGWRTTRIDLELPADTPRPVDPTTKADALAACRQTIAAARHHTEENAQ